MQEPDDTSYHAVVNPLLPGLLSKELCTLAPGQVLSPIQRQVQAPQERQPSGGILYGRGGANFGSTALVCVCVYVSPNTQGKRTRIKTDGGSETGVALPHDCTAGYPSENRANASPRGTDQGEGPALPQPGL